MCLYTCPKIIFKDCEEYKINNKAAIKNKNEFNIITVHQEIDEIKREVNKFNAYKNAGDMVNYEIIVHALKSNCRTLGFMSTGEMFYQHELASKQNDINYVNVHYNELINEVNRVYAILTKYKAMV